MHKKLLRFYNKEDGFRIYFITTVVENRIQFFEENIFKEVLKRNIGLCKYFHDFYLYSFTIQKDHVHFLIQPLKESNISEIIKFIKQNFSQDINNLSSKRIVGADPHPRRIKSNDETKSNRRKNIMENYQINPKYSKKQNLIIKNHKKYLYELQKDWDLTIPYFRWQKTFHDHVIRNYDEFKERFLYIKYNSKNHQMKEDV